MVMEFAATRNITKVKRNLRKQSKVTYKQVPPYVAFMRLLFTWVMFLVAPNSKTTHLAFSGLNVEGGAILKVSGDSEIKIIKLQFHLNKKMKCSVFLSMQKK